MAKKYENLLKKSKLPQTAVDRRLAAAERIAEAIDAASGKPGAKGVKDVCVHPVRIGPGGKSVATGEVEGLRIGDDPTRHAYAAAFRALEKEGIAKLKWNLKDKNKMPTSCKVKKSNIGRMLRFCGCDGGTGGQGRSPKQAPTAPLASWGERGNAKPAVIERRKDAAARISAAAQAAGRQSGLDEIAVGVWLGKACQTSDAKPGDVLFRTKAESAAARTVLGEVSRCNIAAVKLGPLSGAGQRADLFFSREGAEMLARAVEKAAPRAQSVTSPRKEAVSKAASKAVQLAPARKKLEDFCSSCPNPDLKAVMEAAATSCAKGKALPWVSTAISGGRLDKLLAFFAAFPYPASPAIELKYASTVAFGSSKAIDAGLQSAIANIAFLAGAAPCAKPAAAALSTWGIEHASQHVSVGGDFSLAIGSRVFDVSAAGALASLDVSAAGEISGCDARGVRAVVVVENMAAWRQAVRDVGDLACFVTFAGIWNGAALSLVDALRRAIGGERGPAPLLLWFDIDAGGFDRASKLMSRYPDARAVLMGAEDFRAAAEKATLPLTCGRRRVLDDWISKNGGSPFLECALACRDAGYGVEQEAMLDGYAQKRLEEELRALPVLSDAGKGPSTLEEPAPDAAACRFAVDGARRWRRPARRAAAARLACSAAAGAASGLAAALAVVGLLARRGR